MLSFFALFACIAGAAAHAAPTSTKDFDYMVLVMQWAPQACDDYNCKQNPGAWFTLHGLWPNYYDGSYPSFCTSQKFNETLVEDLLPQMNKFWPSFNGANENFWSHEYEKHGTCAESVSKLSTEHGFFATTLSLRAQYDPLPVFESAGITPSTSKKYSVTDMQNAFRDKFGYLPTIQCSGEYVDGASVCIGKDLTIENCPNEYMPCSADSLYLRPYA